MILFLHKIIDIMKNRMYDRERKRRTKFMIENKGRTKCMIGRETEGQNV